MIPETDQWKLEGDCGKCRRKKYCGKLCTTARDNLLEKFYMRLAELARRKDEPEDGRRVD